MPYMINLAVGLFPILQKRKGSVIYCSGAWQQLSVAKIGVMTSVLASAALCGCWKAN